LSLRDLAGCRSYGCAKNLSALTLREARTQAFSDAFYLIMIGFLIAALLVPLMNKPPAH
jgi:DHA2 family multidrug resistance protein